jgi:3-deoxy-manno-octulosonate cytidylyltransferase (CMP-KDO synthetase)
VPLVTVPSPFQRTSQPPHIVALIPARYHSTRLPGKALADIAGKSMIEHVYQRAAETRGIDAVIVATDDERIRAAVERFGGEVRMTKSSHRTGTDRIAEVARDIVCDIVVGIQGDEPLIEPAMIAEVTEPFATSPDLPMTTLRQAIADPDEYANPNVVKVVVDLKGDALYFSRSLVPYFRDRDHAPPQRGRAVVYKHVGLYAYRREFLLAFAALPQTPLEIAESLEQLRALEHGFRIRTVETTHDSIGVDTPEDLERVRIQLTLAARG